MSTNNSKGKSVVKFQPWSVDFNNRGIWKSLWWHYWPGEYIRVNWPSGNIVVNDQDPRWRDMGGAVWVDLGFSADPNDHYRHELEEKCGRQSWDWDWGMGDRDATENRITIKFARRHSHWASYFALKWS